MEQDSGHSGDSGHTIAFRPQASKWAATLRRARGLVARARPDRGPSARTCRAQRPHRPAHRPRARPVADGADRSPLRTAAEGRGLLEQRPARPRPLWRRRSGSEARGVAARLAARAAADRLRVGIHRQGQHARRQAARCSGASRCSGRAAAASDVHGPLRARRRDRPHDRLLGSRGRGDPRDGRTLGWRRLSVRPRGAITFRSSPASSAWRRSWRSSGTRRRRRARCAVARERSGRWFDPDLVDALRGLERDDAFWERLADARARATDVLAPSRRTSRSRPTTRASIASPTRSR